MTTTKLTGVRPYGEDATDLYVRDGVLVDAADVTAAVDWLVSDGARYVTGVALPVDAGFTVR